MDKNDEFDDLLGDLGLGDDSAMPTSSEKKNEISPVETDVQFANYVPSTSRRGGNQRRQIPSGLEIVQDVKTRATKGRWNIDRNARRNSLSFDLDTNEEETRHPASDLFDVDDKFSWLTNNKPTKLQEDQTQKSEPKPESESEPVVNPKPELVEKSEPIIAPPQHDSVDVDLMKTEIKKLTEYLIQKLDEINEETSRKISRDNLQLRNENEIKNAQLLNKLNNCFDKITDLEEKLETKFDQHRSHSSMKEEIAKLRDFIQNENRVEFKAELQRQMDKLENKQTERTNEIMRRNSQKRAPFDGLLNIEWKRLTEEKEKLSRRRSDQHEAWESAYKQLLLDQSSFLEAQARAMARNTNLTPNLTPNLTSKMKDESRLDQRRLKLEENEKNFTQLAHQLKARSDQLENICKTAIQMRNDSFAATLQLAKLVNAGFRNNDESNKYLNCSKYEYADADWPFHRESRTPNNNCSVHWRQLRMDRRDRDRDRDRQSIEFEKLYLSVCRRKSR